MRRPKAWDLDGVTIAELVQCKQVLIKVPARTKTAHLTFGADTLTFERIGDEWYLRTVS